MVEFTFYVNYGIIILHIDICTAKGGISMAVNTRKKLDVSVMNPEVVKSIAERYVTDYENYTIADLCKVYHISKHYFSEIIRRAIVENLISYKMCEAIRDKSSGNQRRHLGNEEPSATAYYKVLFDQRFQYIKEHEDYSKTKAYAKNYISTNCTLNQMAESCHLSPREMLYFIIKGAVCYFTDYEFDMFITKLKRQFAKDRFLDVKLEKIYSYRTQFKRLEEALEIDNQMLSCINESLSSEDEEANRISTLKEHQAESARQLEDFIRSPLY